MKTLLVLLLIGLVFADIPAHCEYDQVLGTWEFHWGKSHLGIWECDDFEPTDHLTLTLKYDGKPYAVDRQGKRHDWTMIYDQGIQILYKEETGEVRKLTFHFYWERVGEKVVTNCSRTGFPSVALPNEVGLPEGWICLRGEKTQSSNGVSSTTVLPAIYLEEYDRPYIPQRAAVYAKAHQKLRRQPFDMHLPEKLGLPRDFFLGNQSNQAPLLDQLSCGSCFAFGEGGAIESRYIKETGKHLHLSRQDIISCNKFSQGCGGGMPLLTAFYAQHFGWAAENDFGYQFSNDVPCEKKHSGPKYFAKNGAVVGGYYWACVENNCDGIVMQYLIDHGSVEVAIKVPTDWYLWYEGSCVYPHKCNDPSYDPDTAVNRPFMLSPTEINSPNPPRWTSVDHSVQIVGYGIDMINGKEVPYWMLQNSWGRHWPEKKGANHPGVIKIDRRESVSQLAVMSMPEVVEFDHEEEN